jgi:hypothetical protein
MNTLHGLALPNQIVTPPLLGVIGLGPVELLVITLVLALTAFWIWMIVECAKRIINGETKLVGWLIVIAFDRVGFPVPGDMRV